MTIFRAIIITATAAAGFALFVCAQLLDINEKNCWEIWGCMVLGLVSGICIGQWTEYVTSFSYKPTQTIAKKSKFGEAGVIIQGLGIGMLSTFVPVIVLFVCILACNELANTYGVGIAAVGMLSTLGVTLATDAFGPVADNAGGIAEMADLPAHVRERTDALDALGNTTAATGKGFAIGSAVLTSLALLTAYTQDTQLEQVDVTKAAVLSAAILGACLPYIFAALTMMAVGRAATMMIGEVRRQFEELNLLGKYPNKPIGQPDYTACVNISTRASLFEMIIPGTAAIVSPLAVGFLLGAEALGGLLVGGITSGFMLAVFMANSGGAWDNAKKWIEANGLGEGRGKNTKYHKAAVVGDTIGDPFKDTSGPALNILIKLMTMISLVFGKNVFKGKGEFDDQWWIGLIITGVFAVGAIGLTLWMRKQGFGKIKDMDNEGDNKVNEDFQSKVGFSV
jgi:H(+)-translocating pyrophosphatase